MDKDVILNKTPKRKKVKIVCKSVISGDLRCYYYGIVIDHIRNRRFKDIKDIFDGKISYEEMNLNIDHELNKKNKEEGWVEYNAEYNIDKDYKKKIKNCKYLTDVAIEYEQLNIIQYFILQKKGNFSSSKKERLIRMIEKSLNSGAPKNIISEDFVKKVFIAKEEQLETLNKQDKNRLKNIIEKLPESEHSMINCVNLLGSVKDCVGTCLIL